jgi:hypothetical protein
LIPSRLQNYTQGSIGVKKVSVNVNLNKTLTLGGRNTPLRSNISTPKGDRSVLFNKSICKTEENNDAKITPSTDKSQRK